MSGIRVSNLRGEAGSAPTFPDGAVVTGVTTSGTFVGALTGNVTGNATGLTGTPDINVGTVTANTVSVGTTLTYEDVTNVDSVGVITARSGIKVGAGESISAVSGTITYYGDGSQLEVYNLALMILRDMILVSLLANQLDLDQMELLEH